MQVARHGLAGLGVAVAVAALAPDAMGAGGPPDGGVVSCTRKITEETDGSWEENLPCAIKHADDRYEVVDYNTFVAILTNRFIDALLRLDTALRSERDGLRPHEVVTWESRVLRNHPGARELQRLRARMASSVLQLPSRTVEDADYVEGAYHIWKVTDGSRMSADRLALGVVDADPLVDEGPPPLTLGRWKRFACWSEDFEDGFLHHCGVRLSGMPKPLQELLADQKLERVRLVWHGLPQPAVARMVLIRGVGYRTRRVLVPLSPFLETLDVDGRVIWSLR
jgi:hypothetical protein